MAQRSLGNPSPRPLGERLREAEVELRVRNHVLRTELLAAPPARDPPAPEREPPVAARGELLQRPSEPAAAAAPSDAAGAEEQLRLHYAMQDRVMDEMKSLAKHLKDNTYAMHDILQRDARVIEETNSVVDGNLVRLKTERQRVQDFTHVVRSGTWSIWVTMLLVVVAFFATYVFMNLFPRSRT
eukprot:Unigene15722_Nuclearia_a/m.46869 Unigene15722_Nuclearia_a/g.46869  ORF Unigene15722_Nuclearia_a/g.46869 Unigene15722_Nuclearia_a/m.46869 type:complete len:184 (+) Unigene15722_Nuclearia_a:75-626(+)